MSRKPAGERMREAPETVLFVHAHPDDETIATGGTIAMLVEAGVAVTVLTCTRGELGEVIPAELKHLEGEGAQLAAYRSGELAAAMRILGVTDHRYLGDEDARQTGLVSRRYRDSGMAWGPTGAGPTEQLDPGSLCAAPLGEVSADIATVLATLRPDAVISYDERGGYGHPDHIRVREATARAADVMNVPFYEIIETADGARQAHDVVVDVSGVIERKTDALRAHRTQVVVDAGEFSLSSGPNRPIATKEVFRNTAEPSAQPPVFASEPLLVRLSTFALCLIVGIGAGVLATINHQASVTLFDIAIPVGMVAADVVVIALFLGLRLVFASRAPAAAAAIGLIAVLLLFAQEGPGGSVLIPANTIGYAWTFGVPLIAALVLAWPKLPSSSTH